ncbi:MAG: hypothetical protein WCK05_15545 [Planctomycetota bacterium]
MKKKRHVGQERPPMHTESVAVRRELAEAYSRQADNPKLTRRERETFARMGAAWRASLSEK